MSFLVNNFALTVLVFKAGAYWLPLPASFEPTTPITWPSKREATAFKRANIPLKNYVETRVHNRFWKGWALRFVHTDEFLAKGSFPNQ